MNNPSPILLIIDDNEPFINRMTGLLRESGFASIDVATNYDEAIAKLEAHIPDIVLLDINLPGKNGVELLKKIRSSVFSCQVIMLSNHASDYYRRICLDLGVTHFLDKSNDFNLVPAIIKNINFSGCSSSI